MKAVCLALACALFLSAASSAQTANAPAAVNDRPLRSYTVECQMVRVPAKAVVTLVPELSDEARVIGAWEKLQAMIARGEATLANLLSARGNEQQHIVAESTEEERLPAEFADPALPALLPATSRALERLQVWPHVGIVPTAFETRNVGPTLTVEIKRTTDPKLLECRLDFAHVELPHVRTFDAGALPNGERIGYSLTDFTALHTKAGLLVESGRPKLVGVHRLPSPEAAFEVVMLTVTATPLRAP